jgi:hypothetical protein
MMFRRPLRLLGALRENGDPQQVLEVQVCPRHLSACKASGNTKEHRAYAKPL